MESQPVDAHVSLFSRMNAFYGIPNQSQETTAAVQQGAQAPEVYSPEEARLPQTPEDNGGETTSPVENFFTEATEQVEISSQAVALQEQAQTVNEPAATPDSAVTTTSAVEETQPESDGATPSNSLNSGSATETGNNGEPAAASALNAETPISSPIENNGVTAQPASGNAEPGPANQLATGSGNNANAGQPGALFSALG